ncbi:hypothetical protein C8Q80DRAFT_164674 [Daedaleopsis nitida]|nr:hypothetical protein C8Q80DRAFT_164674 [Daedaleopsis nitida]
MADMNLGRKVEVRDGRQSLVTAYARDSSSIHRHRSGCASLQTSAPKERFPLVVTSRSVPCIQAGSWSETVTYSSSRLPHGHHHHGTLKSLAIHANHVMFGSACCSRLVQRRRAQSRKNHLWNCVSYLHSPPRRLSLRIPPPTYGSPSPAPSISNPSCTHRPVTHQYPCLPFVHHSRASSAGAMAVCIFRRRVATCASTSIPVPILGKAS